jgi:hypothetical protein
MASCITLSTGESSKTPNHAELIFRSIKRFVNDLNQVSEPTNNMMVPFSYLSLEPNVKKNFNVANNADDNSIFSAQTDYYYHNCLADILVRLYGRNLSDKYALTSYMVALMPKNVELVKLFVNYGVKLNGTRKCLQTFYDHLTINSIDMEHLWLL